TARVVATCAPCCEGRSHGGASARINLVFFACTSRWDDLGVTAPIRRLRSVVLTSPGYEQRGHVCPRRAGFLIFAGCWFTLLTASAVSAARVLDLVTFTPPSGWNIEEKGA